LIKKKSAKTPKKFLPKRRKEFSQNAEKILAKTPKNAMIIV
jgi:vacuolar-type H+-ATPase subunit H